MKTPNTIDDLLQMYKGKKFNEMPPTVREVCRNYNKMYGMVTEAGMYSQFINVDSIKNLGEKIRLLEALKNGANFEDLGLEPGKPKFKLLFEDYPAGGEVII